MLNLVYEQDIPRRVFNEIVEVIGRCPSGDDEKPNVRLRIPEPPKSSSQTLPIWGSYATKGDLEHGRPSRTREAHS